MNSSSNWRLILVSMGLIVVPVIVTAQQRQTPDPQLIAKRNAIERELASIAIVDRKVMVPMQDGKRMAADIYRPKDESKKYPIIFVRTPYNFNWTKPLRGISVA